MDDPTLKVHLLGFCSDLGSWLEGHRVGSAAGPNKVWRRMKNEPLPNFDDFKHA